MWKKKNDCPTGPRGWEAVKTAFRLGQDALAELQRAHQVYGDRVYLPLPNQALCLFHPDDIKHVLSLNHKNYHKSKTYDEVRPMLGEGLVTSEGELWKRQRRAVGKEFGPSAIKNYSTAFIRHTQAMLEKWEQKKDQGPLDIAQEMNNLAMGIACETLFGIQLDSENKTTRQISEGLWEASQVAIDRIYSIIKIPRVIPHPAGLRGDRAIRSLDTVVYGLIDKKEKGGGVLAKLVENGVQGIEARKQLRDEVMTLLLAGHETTANALTWTFYLLSCNPEAEEKIREEILRVCGDRVPSYEDLGNLQYVGMVFQESLRLYPPVPVISRRALGADTIGGVNIQADQDVAFIPHVTHRDPRFWPEPEKFIPERFREEAVKERPSHSYFPFAHGPRKCIGEEFSYVEGKLILATIYQKFRARIVPHFRPIPWATITLRSQNGMMMTLETQGMERPSGGS